MTTNLVNCIHYAGEMINIFLTKDFQCPSALADLLQGLALAHQRYAVASKL